MTTPPLSRRDRACSCMASCVRAGAGPGRVLHQSPVHMDMDPYVGASSNNKWGTAAGCMTMTYGQYCARVVGLRHAWSPGAGAG